jgi:hypothetical protein|tara:strand:+ start:58552 stop:58905 length:354 start_codon:yes stop_codon:yes gene_type:complete
MFSIIELYNIDDKKIKHISKKEHKTNWIGGSCVYKILIDDEVVHTGRSDTCKKHGGAEKTRKAIVQLLGWEKYNPGIKTTKDWKQLREQHMFPTLNDIKVEILFTNNIEKLYNKEKI